MDSIATISISQALSKKSAATIVPTPFKKLRSGLSPVIRRGTFHSASETEQAIYKWLAEWDGSAKPIVWKASADVIHDKVRRCGE